MAKLDKDVNQKEKALRFCISNNMLPFLEVEVPNTREVTDTETVVTDIDVLGIEFTRNNPIKRIVIDCKTVNKMSPINRAFWAAGIMRYTNSQEAFVILEKKAIEAHKLSAKRINVHLLDQSLFDKYAEACNINYLDQRSYAAAIKNWHLLTDIYAQFPKLSLIAKHITSQVPLDDDPSKSFRTFISEVMAIKGELDPEKTKHMAIYCDLVSVIGFILARMANELINIFDPGWTKEEFEKMLRYYIWGGKEGYILRTKISEAVKPVKNGAGMSGFRNWDGLVETVRSLLESPSEIHKVCIPVKELCFRFLLEPNEQSDEVLGAKIRASNRVKQFAIRASSYLFAASGLPKDFHLKFTAELQQVSNG